MVAYNCITLDNEGLDGGVNGVGAEGVRVIGNRIRGTGIAGIDAGTPSTSPGDTRGGPDCGWRIVGNDVSGVDPVNSFGGPAAQIWLGASSSDCLVVGGCARTEVLDEGTDNVLIHVTEIVTGGVARSLGASRASVTGKALLQLAEVLSRPDPVAPAAGRGAVTAAAPRPAAGRSRWRGRRARSGALLARADRHGSPMWSPPKAAPAS